MREGKVHSIPDIRREIKRLKCENRVIHKSWAGLELG